MKKLIKEMADYIIQEGKSQLYEDKFQTVVEDWKIQERFAKDIEEKICEMVEMELSNREEIADIVLDTDGFDIVFYTGYIDGFEEVEED